MIIEVVRGTARTSRVDEFLSENRMFRVDRFTKGATSTTEVVLTFCRREKCLARYVKIDIKGDSEFTIVPIA